ncbi:MAG: hypothetical protein OXF11_19885 [Deltaproteobacteria bacterium]|nr:hypothetical protein [Deltaproteobacteria bacterium]
MGQLEEKIGANFLRFLAAKQRLTVLDGKAKKMIADLNMAIQVLSGKETGHMDDNGIYHIHTRAKSGVPHRQLMLPTIEELAKVVQYKTNAKEEVEALNKEFKDLETRL